MCHGNVTSIFGILIDHSPTCRGTTGSGYVTSSLHNVFKMAAPSRYIRVHDGKASTTSFGVHTVQAMDYTFNMKGSLGEALRASLTLAIKHISNFIYKI